MAGATGRIPSTFIDDLLARVDIVDVIGQRVPLKPKGRNLFARCPFHEERTPSFSVNRERQFYHCFGCSARGTAITFLMEFDGLGFVDAVEDLAARVGLEVPREGFDARRPAPSPGLDLDAVYAALDRGNRYFQRQLREHPARARAVAYLKSRGVSGVLAKRFELGFAPPGWEGLAAALADEGRETLVRAGLVARRDTGTHYDRFRDRVTFPIRDRRGRVVGFGGRVIGEGEPKYLNSSDGVVFRKGRELYGLYQALHGRGGRPARLVVVEGYMDVVALAEFGIDYAVATLGTAATRDQVQQVFRSTGEVVFCFDGDRAGREAAWRALEQTLPLIRDGRQASFLLLPEGDDPDSFVRARGAEAFEAAVGAAAPLSEFLFATLCSESDPATLEGRARIAERAAALIATVPAGAFRTLLADRAADVGRLEREEIQVLLDGFREGRGRRQDPAPARAPSPPQDDRTPSLVRQAIRLLLHRPGLARLAVRSEGVLKALDGLDLRGAPLLAELLRAAVEDPRLTTGALVERYRERPVGAHLARLAGAPLLIEEEEGLEAEFADVLGRLQDTARQQRLQGLGDKARAGPLTEAEKQEYRRLLAERGRLRPGAGSRPVPGSDAGAGSGRRDAGTPIAH